MKLWHEYLIPYLPKNQVLGCHREMCALRGNGWGKKHFVVNYVFKYNPSVLYDYHTQIILRLSQLKYNVNLNWLDQQYRGKKCNPYKLENEMLIYGYKEHNYKLLTENLHNLKYALNDKGKVKGIDLFKNFPGIKDTGSYDKKYWDNYFKGL
jgi:uncharacterized protein (TIGR02328 family)